MSDLDADLYGDLYGADEPSLEDPPVPAKKADPKPAPTAPAKEITSTTASTTATTTPTLSSATESKPQTQNATENAAPSKPLDANPPAATSYASQIASQYMSQNKSTPPTSSIPTVSGAQPIQTVTTSDYNPPPPSREAAYSNVAPIPGAGGASGGPPAYYEHRGVRPSEMKEEG
ncbi:hypothetical protein SISNIDRAFT_172988 [Sistotremastrum niveocremeum HHB9708]|nr:hypothetical protein SISNIDRAFT_172988 [Sistotremastrum niveocremeum HHB9708]